MKLIWIDTASKTNIDINFAGEKICGNIRKKFVKKIKKKQIRKLGEIAELLKLQRKTILVDGAGGKRNGRRHLLLVNAFIYHKICNLPCNCYTNAKVGNWYFGTLSVARMKLIWIDTASEKTLISVTTGRNLCRNSKNLEKKVRKSEKLEVIVKLLKNCKKKPRRSIPS